MSVFFFFLKAGAVNSNISHIEIVLSLCATSDAFSEPVRQQQGSVCDSESK